jgi:hypothetical protein
MILQVEIDVNLNDLNISDHEQVRMMLTPAPGVVSVLSRAADVC